MPKNKLPDNQLDIFNDFNFVPGKKPEQAAGEKGVEEKIEAEPVVPAATGKPKTYNEQIADRVIKEIYEKIEIAKRKSEASKNKPVITSLKGLQAQAEAESKEAEAIKAETETEKIEAETEIDAIRAKISSEQAPVSSEKEKTPASSDKEKTPASSEGAETSEEDDIEPFGPADEYYNRFAGFRRQK